MLARSAPCAIAIRSPSPVLFGGETEPCIGPRRNACVRTGSHSKPPVPRMTPCRARTLVFGPIRTPVTSPESTMSSVARAFGVDRHPGIEQPLEQSGDQRGPGHAQLGGYLVHRRVQARPGLGIETDVGPVSGECGDAACPFAELGEVEGAGAERSAAGGLSARQLRLVIGEAVGDLETQTAVCLDEVQHRRTRLHECLHQRVVHRTERLRAKVLQRVVNRQFPFRTTAMGRDPHDATRHRGGPADGRGLFVHVYGGAGNHRRQCGRERGGAAAEHDDIDFMVPRHGRLSLQLTS